MIEISIHHVTKAELHSSSSGSHAWRTIYVYDREGKVIAEISLFYDSEELPVIVFPERSK